MHPTALTFLEMGRHIWEGGETYLKSVDWDMCEMEGGGGGGRTLR